MNRNQDVVDGFGEEWQTYDQSALTESEGSKLFHEYFSLMPWGKLPKDAVGFDVGCGSGRWARFVAPKVGTLHCIDPSPQALAVAKRNLAEFKNCQFHLADVSQIALDDDSSDFGYSLGVLHHIPDPLDGLRACVKKLRKGAPFLVYLYYAFDNQPWWYRLIWRISESMRWVICRSPLPVRLLLTRTIALTVYWPLARTAKLIERCGVNVVAFPLSAYRRHSLYTMKTDCLDRFGTKLEHRFTKAQISEMLDQAGLENVQFRPGPPFWCALGYRRATA